jgi:hypothetical protein
LRTGLDSPNQLEPAQQFRRCAQVARAILSTPKSVQKLQTALHAKAKAEAGYRFYALYDKISRIKPPVRPPMAR